MQDPRINGGDIAIPSGMNFLRRVDDSPATAFYRATGVSQALSPVVGRVDSRHRVREPRYRAGS